jgi:outer membrane protein assembly factor BamB
VLIVNEDTVTGHDLQTGDELWDFAWPGSSSSSASASQAVGLPGFRVFVSKGYGGGSALLQLTGKGQPRHAKAIWAKPSLLKTKFTNVAMRDGYVYGLSEGVLECVELETGERKWKKGRYGHGQILLVDETLLVITEAGALVAVEASPEAHRELARIEVFSGQTWNNLCLFGDRLLLRNSEEAACYQMAVK